MDLFKNDAKRMTRLTEDAYAAKVTQNITEAIMRLDRVATVLSGLGIDLHDNGKTNEIGNADHVGSDFRAARSCLMNALAPLMYPLPYGMDDDTAMEILEKAISEVSGHIGDTFSRYSTYAYNVGDAMRQENKKNYQEITELTGRIVDGLENRLEALLLTKKECERKTLHGELVGNYVNEIVLRMPDGNGSPGVALFGNGRDRVSDYVSAHIRNAMKNATDAGTKIDIVATASDIARNVLWICEDLGIYHVLTAAPSENEFWDYVVDVLQDWNWKDPDPQA